MLAGCVCNHHCLGEEYLKHYRLFPPRFSDKGRFTSRRPDFVLVTPIAAKTQKRQTNVGGWVFRSGRGQLRETGSTPAAPPATSRATNPRQHWPRDLSKILRDIHLVEIKYCEDTRHQNQLNAAKDSTQISATFSKEPPLLSASSFWVWVAQSTTLTLWSLSRNWVLILKEIRSLPPSSMCTLWTSLLNLSIPDVPFPVLLSTLIRSRFQAKPAILLITNGISFPFRGGEALRDSVAPYP